MKQCNKCNEVKELTEFHKRSAAKDGLQHKCKKCTSLLDRGRQDARNKSNRLFRENNREEYLKQKRAYRRTTKGKIAKYKRDRYANDPAYRLTLLLRNRLRNALNGTNKSASTLELLGCTAEHARFHIESQFTEGMTWENIHVDHIQPCASFDLEDPSEQRKCFHYSNLQPLFASDNLRKSDSIVAEHQVRLL